MSRVFAAGLLIGAAAFAQPLIYNRSILNSASFMPPRLPGGAIAQGSIFTVFGTRFGPTAPAQATTFPLGTTLANVSLTITQGARTVNAIPLYVSDSQINAIMPSNAPVGAASLRVLFGNSRSNPMTVVVAGSAFGIFTATGAGLGPGILQNFVSPELQPINSPVMAAQRGQVVTMWGTGLGPVIADNVAPTAGNIPIKVELFVGGVSASLLYSGRAPCCAGTDQIVFKIPDNAPLGCWVPVYVRTAGAMVSNAVTMAITPDGGSCLSSDSPLPFVTAGRYGVFASLRVNTRETIGTRATIDVTGDYSSAVAYQVPESNFAFHPVYSYPPPGTCTVYTVKGDLLRGDTLPGAVPSGGKALSFGTAFTLTGPRGTKMLQNLLAAPLRFLGSSVTGNFFANTLFLDPGTFQLSSIGGADVVPFSASATMPTALIWTNRDQLTVVDRSQPLNLSWTSGSADQNVVVAGFGVDLPTDSTTVFGCLTPSGSNSFTVPSVILSNVPPTRPNPLQSKSIIYLVNTPGSGIANLNAVGLDQGFAAFQYATGKTVVFR